jgi:hypothetical protein
VKLQVGPNEVEMVLVETNAIPDYDYGYCIVAYDSGLYGNDADEFSRLVWIPEDKVDYQRGRYHSGLYRAKVIEDKNIVAVYTEKLWEALFHKDLPIAQV